MSFQDFPSNSAMCNGMRPDCGSGSDAASGYARQRVDSNISVSVDEATDDADGRVLVLAQTWIGCREAAFKDLEEVQVEELLH